jgi:hypothetical protein
MRQREQHAQEDGEPAARRGRRREYERGRIIIVAEGRVLIAEQRHVRDRAHAPAQVVRGQPPQPFGVRARDDDGEPRDQRGEAGRHAEQAGAGADRPALAQVPAEPAANGGGTADQQEVRERQEEAERDGQTVAALGERHDVDADGMIRARYDGRCVVVHCCAPHEGVARCSPSLRGRSGVRFRGRTRSVRIDPCTERTAIAAHARPSDYSGGFTSEAHCITRTRAQRTHASEIGVPPRFSP